MFLPREPLIEILHLDDHGLFFHSDLWYHILFRRSCTCFCGTVLTGGLLIARLDWYVYSYPLITGNFQLNYICLLVFDISFSASRDLVDLHSAMALRQQQVKARETRQWCEWHKRSGGEMVSTKNITAVYTLCWKL